MSENIKPILDRLAACKPSLYQKDFLLTWERSKDDLHSTLLVAEALEELYRANISSRCSTAALPFRISAINRPAHGSRLLAPRR